MVVVVDLLYAELPLVVGDREYPASGDRPEPPYLEAALLLASRVDLPPYLDTMLPPVRSEEDGPRAEVR